MGELESKFIRFADLAEELERANSSHLGFDDWCDTKGVGKNAVETEKNQVNYNKDALKKYVSVDDFRLEFYKPCEEYRDASSVPLVSISIVIFAVCTVKWLIVIMLCICGEPLADQVGPLFIILSIVSSIIVVIGASKGDEQIHSSKYKKKLEKYNYTQARIKEAEKEIDRKYKLKRDALKDEWERTVCKPARSKMDSLEDRGFTSLMEELNVDGMTNSEVQEIKSILLSHRAETLKEAYAIFDQRQHDRRMEQIAEEEYNRQLRREQLEEDARREYERKAACAKYDAEFDAREAERDRERRAQNYANACRDYDLKLSHPALHGQASIDGAKYRRDKAFADLTK